jgi:hypothetical protein
VRQDEAAGAAGVADFTVGLSVGTTGFAAAVPVAASLTMAASFASACFAFAACFAAACFSIAGCFAIAACLATSAMTDLTAERIKHDLSWRGVESSMWHGLASARVELAAVRLSKVTVAQARRKARFVAMVCPIATHRRAAPQAIRTRARSVCLCQEPSFHPEPVAGAQWCPSIDAVCIASTYMSHMTEPLVPTSQKMNVSIIRPNGGVALAKLLCGELQ